MKFTTSSIVDICLKISLIVALVCSMYILIQGFIFKKPEYKSRFMSWQAPMIFALLVDMYLVE